jgi:hypothetical protein
MRATIFVSERPRKTRVLIQDNQQWRFVMADREVHHYDRERDSGMGGMGAILGVILGVLLVGGLIFFFASDWDRPGDTRLTINNPPAATGSVTTETTGAAPRTAPAPAPANPAR